MTSKDVQTVKRLYYFHNYLPSSIARLFGVSHVIILRILNGRQESPIVVTLECLICGNEDCVKFYIDGNNDNNRPQNVIMLCEYDARRLKHMQMRRNKKEVLTLPSL